MGKKDNKETFNNPFAALKGLSVSGDRPPATPKAKPVAAAAPPAEAEPSFDEAMRQLGVHRIEAAAEPPRPLRKTTTLETPEAGAASGGAPRPGRVLKEVQRGRLHPEAELDLHGLTVAQAMPKVGWFLENATFHGCEVVRIVTGRGKTSPGEEPVLRPQVEELLNGPLRGLVAEWGEAPKTQGGAGALIVVLRLPERE